MTKYKFNIEHTYYAILATFLAASFCHLALVCYYADSEIWLLTLSQQTFSNVHLSSILYKWSFHALTYLFSHFAPTELAVYSYARTGWMVLALCAQLATAYAFSSFAGNRKLFLPLFITVMSFSAFYNQGFRIRGDVLSLFVHMGIMVLFFHLKQKRITYLHYLLLLILNLALVLSTPKSVYLYVAQFAFAISMVFYLKLNRRFYNFIWISHILPIVLALGAATLSYLVGDPLHLMAAVHEAIDYYLKTFDTSFTNAVFFSLNDFSHVIKAFVKSQVHALTFLVGVGVYLYSSYRSKQITIYTCLNVYFGVLFLFIMLHNQKLPFFIGTYGTPLIAYTYLLSYNFFAARLKRHTHLANIIVLGAMVFYAILDLGLNLRLNDNLGQQIAIEIFDDYVKKHPGTTYYDTIGILPRKNTIFLFVGPGEESRKQTIIQDLHREDPTVILYTFKFNYLEPDIRHYLLKHRVQVSTNVWVHGEHFQLVKDPQPFEKIIMLRERPHWHIHAPPQKFIFEFKSGTPIDKEVIYLKNGIETKHLEDADSFALPRKYIDFFQTNVEPIYFLQIPYNLFRYDTEF